MRKRDVTTATPKRIQFNLDRAYLTKKVAKEPESVREQVVFSTLADEHGFFYTAWRYLIG